MVDISKMGHAVQACSVSSVVYCGAWPLATGLDNNCVIGQRWNFVGVGVRVTRSRGHAEVNVARQRNELSRRKAGPVKQNRRCQRHWFIESSTMFYLCLTRPPVKINTCVYSEVAHHIVGVT